MPYRMLAISVLAAVAVAGPALADDDFRYGHIRYLEPGVTVQRSSETGAEEATANLPFLPGDRVWTDGSGRVEFQFADGTLLRVDSRSKLDYVTHDEGGNDHVVLRLWSGGLYLHTHDRRRFADFDIDTPAGLIEVRDRGVFRVDVASGETRLSSYDGEAALNADRRVIVHAGERAYARREGGAESARRFDAREADEFARWDGDREGGEARAAASERYVPEGVAPYASELDSHGSWYFEAEVGNVWRPYVVAGWRPYSEGRWSWTPYGWTWVPNESWGWATSHYGRWGCSGGLGWYWIPGRAWSPAWVSWAIGADTVGWAPLGHHDRPVVLPDRGRAVARGSVADAAASAWIYARRSDLPARDLGRRRIDPGTVDAQSLRVVDSSRARLGHDLHVAEGATARPRHVSTKPTMGDNVPELRVDPETTIPSPWLRYLGNERAKERAKEREGKENRSVGVETRAPERASTPSDDHARPTDARSPRREPSAAADTRERPREQNDSDREVLRRVFQPLSERRSHDGDSGQSTPRTGERDAGSSHARPEPAGAAPRGEPRPQPRTERTPPPEQHGHAVERRPAKDKDR